MSEPIRITLPEGTDPYGVRIEEGKAIIDLPEGFNGGILVIPPGLDFNEHARLIEDPPKVKVDEAVDRLANTVYASAGWCAPSETLYDLSLPFDSEDGDDEEDAVWPQAVRGGVKYETEVTFCDPGPEVLDILTGRSTFTGPYFIEELDTDLVACRCDTEMQACYYVSHVEQDTRGLRHQIIDRKPLP